MFLKVVALWHALSAAEKQAWESAARPHHMTGYAYFISQSLRPNPGIYLPLQGGTMQGDIDMAKFRLLKLPLPTDNQEAATKKYHDDNLPAGGYTEGARAYHDAQQSIPHATYTTLAFNSERWDTDTIHDPVTNNSKLTCKTAGVYVITGHIRWQIGGTGLRFIGILLNNNAWIAGFRCMTADVMAMEMSIASIWKMAVNDFVEIEVYQRQGSARFIEISPYFTPEFGMQRVG